MPRISCIVPPRADPAEPTGGRWSSSRWAWSSRWCCWRCSGNPVTTTEPGPASDSWISIESWFPPHRRPTSSRILRPSSTGTFWQVSRRARPSRSRTSRGDWLRSTAPSGSIPCRMHGSPWTSHGRDSIPRAVVSSSWRLALDACGFPSRRSSPDGSKKTFESGSTTPALSRPISIEPRRRSPFSPMSPSTTRRSVRSGPRDGSRS